MTNIMDTTPECYGAILLKGKSAQEEGDTGEDFDIWTIAKDFQELMDAPNDRVLFADSHEELERAVQEKHLAEPDCTFLAPLHSYFMKNKECEKLSYRKRRHGRDNLIDGWKVFKWPTITEPVGRDRLLELCSVHRHVLVDPSCVNRDDDQLENRPTITDYLRGYGFVVQTSGDDLKLRWAPKNAGLQGWKLNKKETEKYLKGNIPQDILNHLGYCVNPNQWPREHPFCYVVSGQANTTNTYRGRYDDGPINSLSNFSLRTIKDYLRLTQKLWPGHRCWRDRSGPGGYRSPAWTTDFKSILTEALKYIHGMENGKDDDMHWLAKWLRNEARALKIKIPPKPKIPQKPKVKHAQKKSHSRRNARRVRRLLLAVDGGTRHQPTTGIGVDGDHAPAPQRGEAVVHRPQLVGAY